MDCSMADFPVLHYARSELKFMTSESVMLSNNFILCRPLLLFPSIFSTIKVFPKGQFLQEGEKYRSFSFSNIPSNEYSGLISFMPGAGVRSSTHGKGHEEGGPRNSSNISNNPNSFWQRLFFRKWKSKSLWLPRAIWEVTKIVLDTKDILKVITLHFTLPNQS